jgi:hypothetical protein
VTRALLCHEAEEIDTGWGRLGQFDDPSRQPWGHWGLEVVDTPAHRELAMDAALQGFVLLRNEKQVLPLAHDAHLAVLGPNTHDSGSWQLGNYHERAVPPGVLTSPCAGLQAAVLNGSGRVKCVVPGGCYVASNTSCFNQDSAEAIAASEVVLLFVGIDGSQEAEGHDKTSLLLPGTQLAMVAAATAAAAIHHKPVVVLVMGGSALDLSEIKANKQVHAIVWIGCDTSNSQKSACFPMPTELVWLTPNPRGRYPGQASGTAIATALLGESNKWYIIIVISVQQLLVGSRSSELMFLLF